MYYTAYISQRFLYLYNTKAIGPKATSALNVLALDDRSQYGTSVEY
jgi:hypothetical protein